MMNTINGKILVKESNIGIPNLIVAVYDIEPNVKADGSVTKGKGKKEKAIVAPIAQKIPGSRLGSVITNKNGEFTLSYEDSEYQGSIKQKNALTCLLSF